MKEESIKQLSNIQEKSPKKKGHTIVKEVHKVVFLT